MDGGIGVDTVEKEEILKDARNKFICYMYRTHAGLVPGRNLPSCACRVTAVFNVAVEFFSKWPL